MIKHWQAIKDLLSPLGYPVFSVYADQVSPQYVVLTSKAWDDPENKPLAPDASFATDVRVKAVAGTVDGVDIMLSRIRSVLSPGGTEVMLWMADRSAFIWWVRSEVLDVDTSTTITGTNRHPAFGVDTYRLASEPTEELL